ncbi:MAG TPA: outer membrane lipoprotein chaperone LolA [Thermoanaerobaculia bacterium]|nr:outer membrane lipoprotein chaperone LolA [Thermoanaerobaculia bacterium]
MKIAFISSTLLFALTTSAPAAELSVERALAATAGTKAEFVQKFTPKGFTRDRVERGEVIFGPAPQMRWSYRSPESKLFVFDGETSWLYAPDDRQVTVATLSEEDRKALPFVLLADAVALQREYAVRESVEGGSIRTELTPRSEAALVRDLVVVTGAKDHRIRRIEYSDRQGNRTVFEFANHTPARIAAETFRFTPPPGVEVVRN